MSSSDWLQFGLLLIAGLAVLGTVITWCLRVERRLGQMLPRTDHDAICEERRHETLNEMTRLTTQLEEREKATVRYRDQMFEKLDRLGRNVAVLQDRAGLYRFDETQSIPHREG